MIHLLIDSYVIGCGSILLVVMIEPAMLITLPLKIAFIGRSFLVAAFRDRIGFGSTRRDEPEVPENLREAGFPELNLNLRGAIVDVVSGTKFTDEMMNNARPMERYAWLCWEMMMGRLGRVVKDRGGVESWYELPRLKAELEGRNDGNM